MAGVAHDGAVLHHPEVLVAEHRLVAGHRDEEIADARRLLHGQDAVAVQRGLDGLGRVDLGDDDVPPEAARPHRDAAAAPAVSGHHDVGARDEEVRRADDAVHRGLTGPVAVVEEVLRLRLVHRDDRELEHPRCFHRAKPHYAGGRLFRAAEHPFQDRCPIFRVDVGILAERQEEER